MTVFITKRIKFNIPVSRARAQRVLAVSIVFLTVIAAVLGCICLCMALSEGRLTVEAGSVITAADITGDVHAYFGDGFDPECLNHAGVYKFTVITGGEEREVRLRVKDTKAPEVVLRDVYFPVDGELPDPMDYIESVYEPDSFTGEYLTEAPDFKSIGSYKMKVRYTDASGNKTPIYEVTMHHIYDSQPPKIRVVDDVVVYLGDGVSYRSALELSDNCIGEIGIEVDESGLDLTKEGRYKVYVVATDASGNRSERAEVKVYVHSDESVEEELSDEVAKVCRGIIKSGMTAEDKCRAVYEYIQENITYAPTEHKGSAAMAAYEALFVSGAGDCYSYAAAAKAFLDYLEIENLEIQRAVGHTADTHYWNLVNIGDENEPKWYHFDCTRLRVAYNHSGCLLTDKQTEAYGKARPGFYSYDKSAYPPVCEEIITPTPELEKFY